MSAERGRRGAALAALALGVWLSGAAGCGGAGTDGHAANIGGYRVRDGLVLAPDGRALVLRGLNYANDHKTPSGEGGSFLPAWASPQDFVELASWGLNSVRLLVVWEAIEPERGRYDDSYLDAIRERLDWAQAAGVSVIVDMHQDIYARAFGGDGAPAWAVLDDGLPFEPRSPWYLNFASPAVMRAIDNFLADRDGILGHFVEAWAHVVERLADHPAVIGRDLLNEPFPGSLFLFPDVADRDGLDPLYRRLLARLAAIDTRHLFFVEPNAVRTNVLAAGYPTALGPYPEAEGRLVFAPHLYDPIVTATVRYGGNDAIIRFAVNGAAAEATRLGWGLWVGEWSVWDGRVEGGIEFLRDQLRALDDALAGWSFWNLSRNPLDLTSPYQSPEFLDELARPQLTAVAGEPLAIHRDGDRCELRFRERALGVPTEIRVPGRWSRAPRVEVTPSRRVEVTTAAELTTLHLFDDDEAPADVTVTIEKD